ncbi:Hypothetical_protein [Hexamita inflata]|uniref:Hypothetical_protein n=1 Tax=Hexamita inflata TaxID=28002 RepID=A0AA86TYR4_9EUKA|nr:Hypothetical protein HINF_LOCUS21388 [Hexamita inflata]CAI9933744.1 Hypothetical protein HINF_LOCUS21389 [Hexamita inflata]
MTKPNNFEIIPPEHEQSTVAFANTIESLTKMLVIINFPFGCYSPIIAPANAQKPELLIDETFNLIVFTQFNLIYAYISIIPIILAENEWYSVPFAQDKDENTQIFSIVPLLQALPDMNPVLTPITQLLFIVISYIDQFVASQEAINDEILYPQLFSILNYIYISLSLTLLQLFEVIPMEPNSLNKPQLSTLQLIFAFFIIITPSTYPIRPNPLKLFVLAFEYN